MARTLIDTLSRLVAWPTVSSRPVTALAAHMASAHEQSGFRIERFEASDLDGKVNIVASAGPPGTDGLVLSGHMDVVPTDGQPWRSDPFEVVEREGALFGRGTADMKGFLAATLHALARIDVHALRRELVLVWTHDEEVGCLGSARLAHELAERGRSLPEACLIGEPTDFRILRMHPGHVGMELEFTGRAAHSSRPDLGVNAIAAAAQAVQLIDEIAAELRAHTAHADLLERPWVTVNVGEIVGGSAINIVPDRCVVRIGYRPLPGMDPEAVFTTIAERVHARWSEGAGARATARVLRITPSLLTAEGTALQALLAPHAAHPHCGAATFATDGGNLAKLGCRPLIFGPGSIEVAHQADEHVPIDQLVRAVDVIEEIVRARCA